MRALIYILLLQTVRFDTVKIDGRVPLPPSAFRSLIKSHFPLPAVRDSVETFFDDLLIELRDHGFPYAEIRPMSSEFVDGKWILRLKLTCGQPAIVESVVAEGEWRGYSGAIASLLNVKGKIFNIEAVRKASRGFLSDYGVSIDTFWFEPLDRGSLLHVKLTDRRRESVVGALSYQKESGPVGRIEATLNRTLGGFQSMHFRWLRQGPQSQSIELSYKNPWLAGNSIGVDAELSYEVDGNYILSKASAVVFRRFRGMEMGIGGGIRRGTVSNRFGVLSLSSRNVFWRAELSSGEVRTKLRLLREFQQSSTSAILLQCGWFGSFTDGEASERFRFGGPPEFTGTIPDGLVFSNALWGALKLSYRSVFAFLSAGKFDGREVVKFGPGLSTGKFNISLALPDLLLTVDFRASF